MTAFDLTYPRVYTRRSNHVRHWVAFDTNLGEYRLQRHDVLETNVDPLGDYDPSYFGRGNNSIRATLRS